MTECCGQPRTGRFCSPLGDLLKYCRGEERLNCELSRIWGTAKKVESCMRKHRKFKRLAKQWKARGDALAELMARVESEVKPPEAQPPKLSDAIKAIRAAGGDGWDKIPDVEAYLNGDDESEATP